MVKWLCTKVFNSWGWKFQNDIPDDLGSYVALGAPHTSNWDFITAMSIIYNVKNVRSKFLIKSNWMKFPLNLFFTPIGAVGVDREAIKKKANLNSTDVLSNLFHQDDKIALWVAPEGTRSANSRWKTGFYYIALKAKVPIVLAYADWKTKTAGLGKVIYPTGDIDKDMHEITAFYLPMEGKINKNFQVDQRYL